MTVLGDGRASAVPCPTAAVVLRVEVVEDLNANASHGELGTCDQHSDLTDDLIHLPPLRNNHTEVAHGILHKGNDSGVVLVEPGA